MNDKNFDDMIKAQMAGYNSQLNVDDLWKTLQPNIVVPTAVDGSFLTEIINFLFGKKVLFALAAIGFSVASFYAVNQYYNNNNNNNYNKNIAPVSSQEAESDELKVDRKELKAEDLKVESEELNSNELKNEKIEEEKEIEEIREELPFVKNSALKDKKIEIDNAKIVLEKNIASKKIENKNSVVEKVNSLKNKNVDEINVNIANASEKIKENLAIKTAEQNNEFITFTSDESLPLYNFESEIITNNLNKSDKPKIIVTKKKNYPNLLEISSINLNALKNNNNQLAKNDDNADLFFVQDCPTFKRTKFKNFVEPFAGIAAAPSILSQKSNELGNSLVRLRDSIETSLETFNTGVLIGAYHKKNKFAIKTGFNFSRMVERVDIETTTVSVDSIPNQIIKYAVTLQNDTIPIFGTVSKTTTTQNKQKLFNAYQMFDIPLIFEYNFTNELSQRLMYLSLQAGINANFKLNANGSVVDTMQNFVNLNDIAKNRLGLTYFASAGINFNLNKSFVLQASPYLKIIPKSIMKEQYEINQRYNIYGVNFSTRWFFTR